MVYKYIFIFMNSGSKYVQSTSREMSESWEPINIFPIRNVLVFIKTVAQEI